MRQRNAERARLVPVLRAMVLQRGGTLDRGEPVA
jgi:hypothetical protein